MAGREVERRVVSVLFADLVGFTALSEELDAEDVTLVQDAYFDAVRETIARHGGQLEKFVGDAAMAVFGAPRVRDDDAERAVRAGLALVAAVQRVGAGFGLEPGVLRVRVGVASGETVYGTASAERGPVTGDVVNTAARLQAAGEPETVTIGETTALAVAHSIELEALPPFELKGKSEPVPAWRAVGVHAEQSRERALGRLRAPTLGRGGEIARLRALAGSTARVTVVAPPGVGKTRLLDELAAAASDAAIFRARLRPDVLSPFEPVAQLAGGKRSDHAVLIRAAGASDARAAVVAELLGSVGAAAEAHPTAEREQLFSAWLEGLDAIAGERAAVWLVEDVHWASPDLLAFLDLAGSSPRPAGRLVVASARPIVLDERPAWVESGERLDLPLLPAAETEELVRELVGAALPADLIERVAERSAGNPLFVEELLRTWAGVGILVAEDAGWRLSAPAEDVELPLTVQAIYAAQLDDLPAPARAAARRGAVAGRRFPREALAVLSVEEPEAALDTLVRRALVSGADEDALLGPSHTYRHALLRDAGYASLARAERAALHVKLAEWLAARPEESRPALAEVIGRHYAAALEASPTLARDIGGHEREEIRTRAADWFETAARVALGFAAWASARDLAARALELTGEVGVERAGRLQLLGEATAAAVGVDEALPFLEESLATYRKVEAEGIRDAIVDAACSLGRLRLRATTLFSVVAELADELLFELGEREDVATAKLLVLRGTSVLSASDDFAGARADAERALGLARNAGDPGAELEALQLLTDCMEEDDEPARLRWVEVEALARACGRWELVVGAQRSQAFLEGLDEPERTLAALEPAAELAEARGLVDQLAWIDYDRTEAHLAAGNWDDAIAAGLRAIEVAETRASPRIAVRAWFALRPIALARGRTDLIERALPVFGGIRSTTKSPYALVMVGAMELAFAEAGLTPPFVPELEPRLASFDLGYGEPSWMAALEAVIGSWIEAGDLAGARAALDRLRVAVEGKRVSDVARASHALMWSRLLLAEGDSAAAATEAERALATRSPWWRSQALRALEAAGAATPASLAEASELERSLGLEAARA